MIASEKTLSSYVDDYALEHEITPGTISQLRISARALEKWHGSPIPLGALCDELLNRFIVNLLEQNVNAATVQRNRKNILCVWRAAWFADLAVEPKRIRKVKVPVKPPLAWTVDEVRLLLKVAEQVPGKMRTYAVPWRLIWPAFIRTAWDTGLRRGDLLTLCWQQLTPEGQLIVIQGKTAWPLVCRLRPSTIAALQACGADRRHLFFPFDYQVIKTRFHKLVEAAGIRKGTVKWLRRSSATALEIAAPGNAGRHLGHQTNGLAYRHYLDVLQVQSARPSPPEL